MSFKYDETVSYPNPTSPKIADFDLTPDQYTIQEVKAAVGQQTLDLSGYTTITAVFCRNKSKIAIETIDFEYSTPANSANIDRIDAGGYFMTGAVVPADDFKYTAGSGTPEFTIIIVGS